jgi:hypothetical protein
MRRVNTALVMKAATLRKTNGKTDRQDREHANFIRDADMRGVIGTPVSAATAIREQ